MQAAQNHLRSRFSKVVGQPVGIFNLRGETGDRHEIEGALRRKFTGKVEDFVIRGFVGFGSERRQSQQAETGELSDDILPFHEPRHGQAELQQLGVPCSNAAHRNVADPHGSIRSRLSGQKRFNSIQSFLDHVQTGCKRQSDITGEPRTRRP